MVFEAVIGLEVHAQLKTKTKIFCGCSTAFGAPPNTHTCPVCLGMPGVLPVLNKKVVIYAVKMALAANCSIEFNSRFARKNYFYPDLPKGYQISQYELPIARNGYIDIEVDGNKKRVGITRIHMEEDAGKLVHDLNRPVSRVDFNRTGVPLIEIVSEPDIRTPEEAGAYLRALRSIVRYLDICDGNLEEGSFRCDANVSLRPYGTKPLGTRTELKNLNSFKNVEKAIAYEIVRQKALLSEGEPILQASRLWNADANRTTAMRGKEEASDYRYFPDPDLLPLIVDEDWIAEIRATLPELPDQKKTRFITQYSLPDDDADVLTASKPLADYFETCVKQFPYAKLVSNWIRGSLFAYLKTTGKAIENSPVSPDHLAQLLSLIDKGVISQTMAKTVFEEMVQTQAPPKNIVASKGLVQVTDQDTIEKAIDNILMDHPDEVLAYQEGKTKLMGFFMGQIMKATRGKADPKLVTRILAAKLKK
jgi:aspartyl-tRNA(Asn)/glutamyl-tRNA(Gln) amidotransferase subunit B